MFGKRNIMIVVMLGLIWLLADHTWHWEGGLAHASEKSEELPLYLRKISGNRLIRDAAGDQAVSENVYHALFVWDGYYVEKAFLLQSLDIHLHFDAVILSQAASSRIEIDIRRNGKVEYMTYVYELPPGYSGERQIDIFSELDVYPPITFNQGDELGFHFYDIENLSPCQFRYNDTDCRDDSRLILHQSPPDYPILDLSPTSFDLSMVGGTVIDTVLEIHNGGNTTMFYSLNLPQGLKTLRYDDGDFALGWSLSDQYVWDFFNVRFTPAQACTLKSAWLRLSEDGSSGTPDLKVYIWDDAGGFPGAKLDSVLIPYESLSFSTWQIVDVSQKNLIIPAHDDFHIGFTPVSHGPGDTLALFSDDGLPVGNQRRSSGLWGQNWKTIYQHYDIDPNFMILAKADYGAQPSWVSVGSYLGFIIPDAVQQIQLHLDATGLSDGVYKSGVIVGNDSPDRSIIVPLTLRVGQTPVEDNRTESTPRHSFLSSNYPNPFNVGTSVSYLVGSTVLGQESWPVQLAIYNVLGQRVRTLVDGFQKSGSYSVWWDGRDEMGVEVTSGMYLCRLVVSDFQQVRKMLLLR
jgi:hypothetical protein